MGGGPVLHNWHDSWILLFLLIEEKKIYNLYKDSGFV